MQADIAFRGSSPLFELIKSGGWVMLPIILGSIAAVAIAKVSSLLKWNAERREGARRDHVHDSRASGTQW